MSDLERELRAYAGALGPTPAERARILDRVIERRARPRWPLALGGAALALASAALGAVLATRAVPADRAIGPGAGWEALTDDVAIHSGGRGTWRDGVLLWDEGPLRVSVTPGRAARLRILTPEAVIEVVGTVFGVSRDPYGTHVDVERGRVSVSCVGSVEEILPAGGRRLCFRSADAGLGEVLRLERAGAPPAAWHPEVERALAHPWGSDAARTELLGYHVSGLLALGRTEAALEAARGLLARPSPPRAPLAEVAKVLLERDGCEAAAPFLWALAGQGDGVAAVWLADCAVDPAERRRALELGLADPRPEVRDAITERLRDQPGGDRSRESGRGERD